MNSVEQIKEHLHTAKTQFGDKICLTSSFQTQSVPLLYLVSQSIPDTPILFLDTGFHFSETLEFRDKLIEMFGLNVINISTGLGHDNFKFQYGNLYEIDPDLCCHINKTQPLQEALEGYDAWIAGVRGDQTENRSQLEVFNKMQNGRTKICPLINWTKKDLWTFHSQNDLPSHPLFSQGYLSVGCAPCTRPIGVGEDERAGRWTNNCKTECGIHTQIQ